MLECHRASVPFLRAAWDSEFTLILEDLPCSERIHFSIFCAWDYLRTAPGKCLSRFAIVGRDHESINQIDSPSLVFGSVMSPFLIAAQISPLSLSLLVGEWFARRALGLVSLCLWFALHLGKVWLR